MHRRAAHLDPEPERADIGPHQHFLFGFGDEDRIGGIALQIGHQRAVAGGFLFDHGLQVDPRRRGDPGAAQGIEGKEDLRLTGLHVGPAPAIEPVALDTGLKRWGAPHVLGAGGDDIDMRLQDQRTSAFLPGPVGAHDDGGVGMAVAVFAAAFVVFDGGAVHVELVDLVSAVGHLTGDEFDDLVLLPACGGETDQGLGEVELFIEPVVHRLDDRVLEVLGKGHGGILFPGRRGSRAAIGRSDPWM